MATHVSSPARRASRLSGVDLLRFVAAMSVLGFHYTGINPSWPGGHPPAELVGLGRWAAYGAMGVPLFFVISGFVILMTAWGRDLPQFVASRFSRLFPAYWAGVAVTAALVFVLWPAGLRGDHSKSSALLNLTMMQSAFHVRDLEGVYWTLWYEARFYLLIGVFLLVGITRQRVLAFAALWPLVATLASLTDQQFLGALLMPDYAPYFAGGMLLYVLYRDGHDLATWLLLAMQSLFALNFALGYYPHALTVATGWGVSRTLVALISFACFGLVAIAALTPIRDLHARWMTTLGALTYPLYLVHENLGYYVIHLLRGRTGPWIAIAAAAVCAAAVAALLHYFVEQPLGGRLRNAMLRSMRRGTAPAPAPPARRQQAATRHERPELISRGPRSHDTDRIAALTPATSD